MLKFLYSLFWEEKMPMTLEEAYKILEDVEVKTEKVEPLELETPFDEDYVALGKTGLITDIKDGVIIIDDLFHFKSDSPYFHKGIKVLYNAVLSKDDHIATNVVPLDNAESNWDIVQENKSKWSLRTILCKVDQKNGRKLILNPGNIIIDLNYIASDFVPTTGDWVQLDAKCVVDENVLDLNGEILETLKITPLRPHVKLCTVSSWNSEENEGVLSNVIYFNKECLSGGYTPLKNDKVFAEIIESDQGRCAFRALKVLPDYMKPNWDDVKNKIMVDTESSVDGIRIDKPECLRFKNLKEVRKFSVFIRNELNKELTVVKVEFPKSNSQCKVLDGIKDVSVSPNDALELFCECTTAHMGKSREYFVVFTTEGESRIWIDIFVESKEVPNRGSYSNKSRGYTHRETNDIVKGVKSFAPPRFIAVRCQDYTLPRRLLDTVTKYSNNYRDTVLLQEELYSMKPCLKNNLHYSNYLDKFHTLLFLEEIQNLVEMSNYDQSHTIFLKNNEFLMLEIENLSERRPSIIIGDRIFAKDSYGHDKMDWEGYVHKLGAKHVYLKFSPRFHDKYNDEDYDIRVVASRTSFRRLHHAVDLAVKNLGPDILFPSKVTMQEPQVKFRFTDDDLGAKSVSNKKETLNKILQYKKCSEVEKEEYKEQILNRSFNEKNVLKVDWFNKSLNHQQKEAVKNVLSGQARPLPYIIFGPPGTGKTVTLVECILQILRCIPSSRLLIAAPSNSACDLIAFRLIETGVLKPGDLVRFVANYYVPNIPVALAPYAATGDLSKNGTNTKAATTLENGLTLGLTSQVLGRHRITVTTCSSAGALYTMGFPRGHFSHILIDEAGQAMEPDVMIPLVFLDKSSGQAVLAGDPQQLGPVIISSLASDLGLSESYVERLINRFPYSRDPDGFPETGGYDPRLVTKLLCNYRSQPSLLKLTSSLFYDDDLIPMLSDEDKDSEGVMLLEKLDKILLRNQVTKKLPNIIFHGINGENFQTQDSPSWFNPSEAGQIFFYINDLYRFGLKCEDIGVISPYVKQVKEIRNILNEAEFEIPKIGSVEEFQGQEFNVVLLSTVRSNQEYISFDVKHSLGFIASPRRLNVAISRARVLLIIVGNPNLLYNDKYWQSIIDYAIANGNYIGCPLTFRD